MDFKKLAIGILFLVAALYCVFSLMTKDFTTYTATGAALFAFVGIAFIKTARGR